MTRLYLFAEGQTEQTFANIVLAPHLANHGVYLQPAVLIAHARKRGRVHRGGGRNYQVMKKDICNFLKQEKSVDVYFTTMLDLYALAPEFPNLTESEKLRHLPIERVAFLEVAFAADVADRRFIPYLQLHEYEAYLFSEPKWFAFYYETHEKQIAELIAICDQYESPEFINDGPHTAPSKRIIELFPDYDDAKPAQGSGIAELIGLNAIRQKCHHFSEWVSRLEALGNVDSIND